VFTIVERLGKKDKCIAFDYQMTRLLDGHHDIVYISFSNALTPMVYEARVQN
jgi:hypothetical protein